MLKIERDMERKRMIKKLDENKTVLLISFVQSKNCLWDEKHPDFKKVSVTKKLWNEIGGQLNITGDEAKLKWKKLKEKFKKSLRTELEKNKGSEFSPAAPSWKFYNSMLFLKDNMHLEASKSNSSMTTNTASKVVSSGQPEEKNDDFEEFDFDYFIQRSARKEANEDKEVQSRKLGPRSSKRKITSNDETDKNKKSQEKRVLLSPTLIHQDVRKGNDDHHFLLSLMPYIQALNPVEKLELRSQIQNLVTASFKKHEVDRYSKKYH